MKAEEARKITESTKLTQSGLGYCIEMIKRASNRGCSEIILIGITNDDVINLIELGYEITLVFVNKFTGQKDYKCKW